MVLINWERSIEPIWVDISEWVKCSLDGCVALEIQSFYGFTLVLISAELLVFLKIIGTLKDPLHFIMSFFLQE